MRGTGLSEGGLGIPASCRLHLWVGRGPTQLLVDSLPHSMLESPLEPPQMMRRE